MRPISKYIALTCSTALLIGLSAGCGGSDKASSADTNVAPSATSVVAVTPSVADTVSCVMRTMEISTFAANERVSG